MEALQIKAEDTLTGRPLKMEVDLVVLLVGMIPGMELRNLKILPLEANKHGFLQSADWQLHKNNSSQPGIFLSRNLQWANEYRRNHGTCPFRSF